MDLRKSEFNLINNSIINRNTVMEKTSLQSIRKEVENKKKSSANNIESGPGYKIQFAYVRSKTP